MCAEAVASAVGYRADALDRRVPRARPPLQPISVAALADAEEAGR
jgi:hypothetical protein